MPKPKLSKDDRNALRAKVKVLLKKGTPNAEILKTIAKQYSVTPESVRWHMKKMGGKSGRTARGPKKATSRRARKPASLVRKAANGVLSAVVTVSGAVLKKAQEARKLLPKLEKKLLESDRLAHLQAHATKALHAAQVQATRLKKRIASLISG